MGDGGAFRIPARLQPHELSHECRREGPDWGKPLTREVTLGIPALRCPCFDVVQDIVAMPDFESNVQNVQQRLGRRLSGQELRLLQMWDSITQTAPREVFAQGEEADAAEAPSGEPEHQGRFKVAFNNGHFEVFFVCSSVLFRGVAIDRKEDVLAFLTQPPIDLDPLLVRQAVAAAEHMKPTQINYAVSVPDVVLRSMGFERN